MLAIFTLVIDINAYYRMQIFKQSRSTKAIDNLTEMSLEIKFA